MCSSSVGGSSQQFGTHSHRGRSAHRPSAIRYNRARDAWLGTWINRMHKQVHPAAAAAHKSRGPKTKSEFNGERQECIHTKMHLQRYAAAAGAWIMHRAQSQSWERRVRCGRGWKYIHNTHTVWHLQLQINWYLQTNDVGPQCRQKHYTTMFAKQPLFIAISQYDAHSLCVVCCCCCWVCVYG
jgi:hypothetical protein